MDAVTCSKVFTPRGHPELRLKKVWWGFEPDYYRHAD
jgi:hypothetical protein